MEMRSYSEQVRRYLIIGNYSSHTIKSYVCQVRHALDQIGGPPESWTSEDIRQYLYYLRTERGCGPATLNQAYSAIKILHVGVLGRSWDGLTLPRSRRNKRLPQVLSVDEVKRLLGALKNLKHRVILQLLYTSGLRLGELIQLKLTDIDSKRMQVRVEQGKGRKDRYTLLSQKTLEQLRDYYRYYHPRQWLFEGWCPGKPYSRRSVQNVFQRAKKKAGINKPASVHTLRHSFATHLLDAGVDIVTLRDLLGHRSITTTMRYVRLRSRQLEGHDHPLDALL